jgi:hypothetical protein
MGFLPFVEIGRKKCGKRRRGELLVLDCGMKDCALPQAVILRWESNIAVLLEEIFIFFFIPSPLCHAFLPGNTDIIDTIYKYFCLCMA